MQDRAQCVPGLPSDLLSWSPPKPPLFLQTRSTARSSGPGRLLANAICSVTPQYGKPTEAPSKFIFGVATGLSGYVEPVVYRIKLTGRMSIAAAMQILSGGDRSARVLPRTAPFAQKGSFLKGLTVDPCLGKFHWPLLSMCKERPLRQTACLIWSLPKYSCSALERLRDTLNGSCS